MDLESFKEEIEYLFHPEPDEDGIPPREFPNSRLRDTLELNFSYTEEFNWEGASTHKYTRLCPKDEERLHRLTRNKDVPDRLFGTALHLITDSIIEYHSTPTRQWDIHYYPPIVFTFWAGFEAFVRYSSELVIVTVLNMPAEVVRYLREEEPWITKKGEIRIKPRFHPVLDRYAVFLKYAYGYDGDRGARFWQELEKAKELRDYYTHLDVSEPRVLKASEVLAYLEAILLGIIIPSSHLQRSLMLGVYWLYDIWTCLHENYEEYSEKPFFIDWHLNERYMFHCNFENVDNSRFPNIREEYDKDSE
jgi:hypothetical protein